LEDLTTGTAYRLVDNRGRSEPHEFLKLNSLSTGIREFIVNIIIKNSSDDESLHKQRTYLNKLNMVLVQILKQEWPHNWPDFIPSIVASSKANLSLCENNMAILKLLRCVFLGGWLISVAGTDPSTHPVSARRFSTSQRNR
jgi:hypothetical protein